MTLTELRYIVALAREAHFGRAAERCHVSQPTLSVAVRKLEEELGGTLFERSTPQITLTALGAQVVAQAQTVLEAADQIRTLAAHHRDPLVGPLRLGVIYTIGPYLLPHLVPLMHERAVQMPLLIEEAFTAQLAARLRSGELDAIVVALPFADPAFDTCPLYEEPFVALLPLAHPWAGKPRITPAELAQEDLLLLGAGHCFREQVIQICPECLQHARRPERNGQIIEGGSLETIRHMVASGLGVTVLPCSAAGVDRYSQRLLRIKRFADPVPSRTVVLAWRKSFTRLPALAVLHQAISACQLSCVQPLACSTTLLASGTGI